MQVWAGVGVGFARMYVTAAERGVVGLLLSLLAATSAGWR